MRKLLAGLLVGLLLSFTVATFAQKLGRSTPMAGGPPGQGFLADYDSGMITVPASATVVTTSTVLVTNIYCAGVATGALTMTDNQGSPQTYIPGTTVTIATTSQFLNAGKGIQMKGIKWSATGTINCQISGYY